MDVADDGPGGKAIRSGWTRPHLLTSNCVCWVAPSWWFLPGWKTFWFDEEVGPERGSGIGTSKGLP